MANIFVSYKAEDRPRVLPLVKALEAEGFSLWWDMHIEGAEDWREQIQKELDAAQCVIVAWSKLAVGPSGRFVRDEATRAQRLGTYLPIRIDDVDLPLGFGEVQAFDLVHWKGNANDPRFRQLVDRARRDIAGKGSGVVPSSSTTSARTASRRNVLIAGGVSLAAITSVGLWAVNKGIFSDAPRLVVLPFTEMDRPKEAEYFSAGLTEELRGALRRAGLKVIGRTSTDSLSNLSTSEIVDRLHATHLLTGSIRRTTNSIRVSAQLIDGSNELEVWGQTYNRPAGAIVAIQNDLATSVAEMLRVALGAETRKGMEKGGTNNAEALDLFLQAMGIARTQGPRPDNLTTTISLLSKAIDIDGNFAKAMVWKGIMVSTYAGMMASTEVERNHQFAEADQLYLKALSIAPGLAYGHVALAMAASNSLQFEKSVRLAGNAYRLGDTDPDVLNFVGQILPWLGQIDDAASASDQFLSVDPLHPMAHLCRAAVYRVTGKHSLEVDAVGEALKIEPENGASKLRMIEALIGDQQAGKAKKLADAMQANDPFRSVNLGIIAAKTGAVDEAQVHVAALKKQVGDLFSYQYAQIWAQGGDKSAAIASLKKAVEVRDPGLFQMLRDPFLLPLRNEDQFQAIIRQLRFPNAA